MKYGSGRLLVALAGLLWASATLAQPAPGSHRIAFVNIGPAGPNAPNVASMLAGLASLGYVEGRNLSVDYRWANQRVDQLPTLVNELLALKPQIVFSTGGAATLRAVKAATTTVPIIFVTGDPVAEGFVQNLARPGGNATGFAVLAGDLEAKRLQILKEMLPHAKRIAVLWNPAQPSIGPIFRDTENAAARLGLTLISWQARNPAEIEAAFPAIVQAKPDALFVVADPVLGFERARIVDFANRNRLPAMYFWREFAEIGGLGSYGTNLTSVYRQAAGYMDRILKGAKPGELPIQQPTTFEFILNMKTARELGITIPPSIRQLADETIE